MRKNDKNNLLKILKGARKHVMYQTLAQVNCIIQTQRAEVKK